MIRRLILTSLLALMGFVVVKSIPDIARYLKMREM